MMNSSIYKWNDIIQTSLNWNDNSTSKGGIVVKMFDSNDSVQENLKLINYDGKILEWQIADKDFKWANLKSLDLSQIITDTLSVLREKNKMKFIRAIVQKNKNCTAASNYIKIDSLSTVKGSIKADLPYHSMFLCYPNPVTNDILYIRLSNDIIGNCSVDLMTLLG